MILKYKCRLMGFCPISRHLSYSLVYIAYKINKRNNKMKINKTNAARLLDKAKIAYELIPYEVDENDLSAIHVAASLGENIEQVFKTLVLHGDKSGYFVCVIPGEHEVDLKLAAKASGNKKCISSNNHTDHCNKEFQKCF